jgi:hypothetical protein
MDEVSPDQWREEPEASQWPRGPRLSILDLFILTACCAAGMALFVGVRNSVEEPDFPSALTALIFGVIAPSAFGGVVFGYPALMLSFALKGRLQRPLTLGEVVGLAPGVAIGVGIAASWLLHAIAVETETDSPLMALYYWFMALLVFLTFLAPIAAVAYYIHRCKHDVAVPWTDTFGIVAALFPWVWWVALVLLAQFFE